MENQEQLQKNIKNERSNRKKFWIYILIFLGLIIFAIWFNYGSVHPCGILKVEIRNIYQTEMKKVNDPLGGLFGFFIEDPLIDLMVDRLSPGACINRIITIKFGTKQEINKQLEEDLGWLFYH